MVSFTDSFPDNSILAILGDDITHIEPGGGTTELKGEFEFKFLDDELGDQVDIIYPVAEIGNADAVGISAKDSRIRVSGVVYKILRKRPIAVGKTQLVLRST